MADSREYRTKFFVSSMVFLGLLMGILVTVFFLNRSLSAAKLDLTEDKLFTISGPTKEILNELQDDINVRYYVSEEVPSFLVNLKRDTLDMFREMSILSGGKFKYEVLAPEEEARRHAAKEVALYYEAKDKNQTPKEPQAQDSIEDLFMGQGKMKKSDADLAEARLEKAKARAKARAELKKGSSTVDADEMKRLVDAENRQLLLNDFQETYLLDLQKQGISPVPVEERQASSTREISFYTAIEIKYLDKTPELIPVHHQPQALEYELASKILKLTRRAKPKVVFFDGRKPEMPSFDPRNPMRQPPLSDYQAIINHLAELFDIDEIRLKEGDSISDVLKRIKEDLEKKDDDRPREDKPERISCLVVAQPSDLEARQILEISKAVSEGIPAVFLVSGYSVDVSEQGTQQALPISVLRSGLDDLFRSWGITLGKDVVASRECGTTMLPGGRMGNLQFMQLYPLPILLKAVGDAVNQQHPLTNRIPYLVFPAAVGLTVNQEDVKKAGLQVTELANSGKLSYTVAISMFQQNMFNQVQTPSVLPRGGMGGNKELYDRSHRKDGFIDAKPLAVLLEGTFPFKYQDQPIPEWKKEEPKDPDNPNPHGLPPGMNFPGLKGPGGPQGPEGEGAAAPAQEPAGAGPAPASGAAEPAQPVPAAAAPAEEIPPPAAPAVPAAAPPAEGQPPAAPEATPGAQGAPEPKKEAEKAHVEVKPGRVVILSSADMMKNNFLVRNQEYRPNVNFLDNIIETFGLDERLLQIRRKELTERRFKSGSGESSAPTAILWVNLAIVPGLVGLFGIVRFLNRRRESRAYERQYIDRKSA